MNFSDSELNLANFEYIFQLVPRCCGAQKKRTGIEKIPKGWLSCGGFQRRKQEHGGSLLVCGGCISPPYCWFSDNDLVIGLDNGLALTPPMGWMDWERFRCNIDCNKDPNNCISEWLIKQMADRLAEDGYRDAGYKYVSIDDCWSNMKRDPSGNLQPNSTRFPSGMKALADYLHSKGLKLGIYADYGVLTCAGYPGSIQHMEQDAKTFASWEVDYLKWPDKQTRIGIKPDYAAIAKTCNSWRNYHDVQDTWASVLEIVDHFADNQDTFTAAAGPGHWNDPDMLVIGNFGLNYDKSKAQFALWSVLAAPLIMSNDLRNISTEARDVLLNREVIAVSQDKLGKMGKRMFTKDGFGSMVTCLVR
ncbi:hypothetical protein OS493_021199 [Desmophyllum pertusum]|uniref:Alpha-galactosidase n=1 Tax=Desmophyllum pertusum TaxID=174260 RepID=A0A9X0D3P8_9CNID|nr:hypothetical protein OS493_021199 [Desmophyllum pertusum]